MNKYKLNGPNEFLAPPKPLERGTITAKDLARSTTADECVELVRKWADEVYYAWSSNYSLVSQISDGFSDGIKQRTANKVAISIRSTSTHNNL